MVKVLPLHPSWFHCVQCVTQFVRLIIPSQTITYIFPKSIAAHMCVCVRACMHASNFVNYISTQQFRQARIELDTQTHMFMCAGGLRPTCQ